MYMEYNAFDAGVEPGGLRNSNEIRLLICYILANISEPLSKTQITDTLQQEALANYFEISEAILVLSEQKCIEKTIYLDDEKYRVTEKGIQTLNMLKNHLPLTAREKSIARAEKIIERSRHERENRVTIDKSNGSILVTLTILDGESELLSVRIPVLRMEEAENIKNKFFNNPTLLYKNVLLALTDIPED